MDAGTASIIVAVIGASGALATKVVGDLRTIKRQVTPSNGTPTAAILEELREEYRENVKAAIADRNELRADLTSLKQDISYHVTVQHGRGPLED